MAVRSCIWGYDVLGKARYEACHCCLAHVKIGRFGKKMRGRMCTYSNTAGLGHWDQEVSRRNLKPIQGNGLVRHLECGFRL